MAQQLTIVMAQLNFLVGDIDGNTDLVIASARRAITEQSADMIVFPELTLVGYPPEDLLLRPSLQVRVEKALAKILAANLDIFLVLGYPFRQSAKLYNTERSVSLSAIPTKTLADRYPSKRFAICVISAPSMTELL